MKKLKNLTQLISEIQNCKDKEKYNPYIDYIRFPFFKNIQPNTKIEFLFPLSIFVGKNGCGKSSALQALYGIPDGNNIGEFWFSTNLDPIVEGDGNKNRFIYSYYSTDAKRSVEIRIAREKGRDKKTKQVNPDYWESTKPVIADDMEKMPDASEPFQGRTLTRWNGIKKNVIYLDFRQELSAFDKAFYFHEIIPTQLKKQDFLRYRIDSGLFPDLNGEKRDAKLKKREMFEKRELSRKEIEWMNYILDKNYLSGFYMEHDFFNVKGFSIIFTTNEQKYSEAFAGSGESSIARLVVSIIRASEKSLILLDEPEVSLHPTAQARLQYFLLIQILEKKHQIIISTHSSILTNNLPENAVKLFYSTSIDKFFRVQNETYPFHASYHLGSDIAPDSIHIMVEDRLAKFLVEKALRFIGNDLGVKVIFQPGGVNTIKKDYIRHHAASKNKKIFFLLDGDQKSTHIDPDTIPYSEAHTLDDIIKKQIGSSISFPHDGNHNSTDVKKKDENITKQRREFLKYYFNHVFYLSRNTPEEFIWENTSELSQEEKSKYKDKTDFKSKFDAYTKTVLEDNVGSDEIFHEQKRMINKISRDCNDMSELIKTLKKIFSLLNKEEGL